MTKEIRIPFGKEGVLVGDLHVSPGSPDLLILCHGFTDTKDVYGIKRLAELLEKHINVYRFTFTDKEPDLAEESQNLQSVTDFFSLQYKSIVVAGHSLGGLSALLSTFNNKRIDKLILINPFVYIFKKIAWRFRKVLIASSLLYPFIERVRTNFSFYFKTFKPQKLMTPTLIIVGTNDSLVHPMHGQTLYNQIGSATKKLVMDTDIDHGLTTEHHLQKVTDHIINWLQTQK